MEPISDKEAKTIDKYGLYPETDSENDEFHNQAKNYLIKHVKSIFDDNQVSFTFMLYLILSLEKLSSCRKICVWKSKKTKRIAFSRNQTGNKRRQP